MSTRATRRGKKTTLDGVLETEGSTVTSTRETTPVGGDGPIANRTRRGSAASTTLSDLIGSPSRRAASEPPSDVPVRHSLAGSRASTRQSSVTPSISSRGGSVEPGLDEDEELEEEEEATELVDADINSITTTFEFMGPHGTALAVLGVPVVTLALQLLCDPVKGCPSSNFYESPLAYFTDRISHATFFKLEAVAAIFGWMIFQALLYGYLPGTYIQGVPLPTGERLTYKINAFGCMIATYIAAYAVFSVKGLGPFLWVADNTLPLAVAATIYAIIQSVLLYVLSHRIPPHGQILLAKGGNSGYPIYDFWMGRELNPRLWGWFDLKYFCELRPGLVGWSVLNVCLACRQWVNLGGTLTPGMVMVVLFEGYYVIDAQWNEPAILTTMDITTDGFGFMLTFGDLVWVPFNYSLQALYLSRNPESLSSAAVAGICLLQLFGIYIFRSANSEKNLFRTNPDDPAVQHLEYIQTKRGSRLLVSGWWGLARHINYFGDWLMSLSWCLTTGCSSPIPYFYCIYFAILLIHREIRDEHKCRNKYGEDWEEYCRRVKWRIVPYIW
ncbi:uncharacterized protein SPPG_08843 [Spizellomyces punctatus DAOM BR117]|uniref:Delta(14)-sterol reductase ERG24 n=1 Tax=Spizellomyces punctatus (strain DAOM BR117) TaxID=645134 RepID=A0A0L0HUX8_SPIPD|nr:uncharacterized protein SPPG_08843 [Spizellomyces punctatus DAOM BR117]KND04700.1 hypothetical protein SPPG_08843 [Spizellomyces punctatus DAOM BR117]|eukprot:XP_016612739.1 hypothetical protein SPPG_08843 [Spizellomyces punctatus DAOM BR117]